MTILPVIVSGALAGGAIYWRFSIESRKKSSIKNKWIELMRELKLQTKKTMLVPVVREVNFIDNGFTLLINIPTGLSYKNIEEAKDSIENKFKGIAVIQDIRFSNKCKIKIICKDIGKYEFEPVKTKDNEIYVGKTFDGSPYLIDITKAAHILIAGATGTGKSFLLGTILTNLIYNSSKYIELHLLQIMKGEVALFEKCKPVKFVGKTLAEVAYDLEKLENLVNERSKKFSELGVKNLSHYNSHYKNKMKRIYCVTEEISFFMPTDGEEEDIKNIKKRCWASIITIAKAGRTSGIHLISVTQRSTTTNIPSDLKSQLCRITLKQISKIDSLNVIECDLATKLQDRECLVYGDSKEMEIIKIPFADEDFKVLNQFVAEILVPQVEKTKEEDVIIPRELPLYIPQVKEVKEENIKVEEPKEVQRARIRRGMIKC